MFAISKCEECPMCGLIICGIGKDKKKQIATQKAYDDVRKNLYLHWTIGIQCKDEFKMYEDGLKDFLRPKFLQIGFKVIRNIVAYING